MLLFINILICVHIFTVRSHSEFFVSHHSGEIFDITTIYKIKEFSDINDKDGAVGFMNNSFLSHHRDNCLIEIHSRTNAIGLPVQNKNPVQQQNVLELIDNGWFKNYSHVNVSYDSEMMFKLNSINLNGRSCYESYSTTELYEQRLGIQFRNSLYYDVIEFNLENESYYNSQKPANITVQWISVAKKTCFAITYILHMDLKIKINIKNKNNDLIVSTYLKKSNGIQTLRITDLNLIKDQIYTLEIISDEMYQFDGHQKGILFGLLQIGQYSNYDETDRIVSMDDVSDLFPIHILGNEKVTIRHQILDSACLNGGFNSTHKQCVCPPGFKGQYCEEGCGSNLYGEDCKGVCSMYSKKQCRGMFMCTPYYGCTCPPGLTGPFCNKDCEHGEYGNNCEQICSSHCHNNACDRYTGNCTQGCSPEYIPPYCLQKYPYLINPPQLVSNNYDTMELLLNFQPTNIKGGEPNAKLTCYKLLYKIINEDEFISSEFKLITINDNGAEEVIQDLEPDTIYLVGVLVVADDGNFNDEDIVYGKYRTLCISPENVDYNIKLVSGVKSVNITWNTITPKRFECKVTEYSLSLTSDKTQDQISGIQEIISSSSNGHFLNDLIPGYKYNITMTPKTHYGPLQSSQTYTFSPLTAEEDVKINKIVASTDSGKVTITWKLENSVQNGATIDEPRNCIVKYRLNRILSCSSKVLHRNWTTVTVYNKTTFEIFNTVPNSQYCIQVLVAIKDKNNIKQENIVYALTPATSPQIEPIFDFVHPMYVTNNSVFFQWKFDQINCSKLNGFFVKFYVELKDKIDDTLRVTETKQNYIVFDELKSNTPYELKVFIKTHIGYNREYFLLTNFTTKYENLKPVDDLVVYKKSLKNRMVGLRWSYLENTNVDGFIISFDEYNFTNNKNVTIIPLNRCSAWPDYYCHTFYNLSPSINYTLKIKPKSQDYPEGGKISSILFNSIDELPDSPNNLITTEISNTTVSLLWNIPWIFNGLLKAFNINVEEVAALEMDTCCVSISPIEIPIQEELPTYNYTLTDLKPGSTYSIGVVTVTRSLWHSSPARISVTTLL